MIGSLVSLVLVAALVQGQATAAGPEPEPNPLLVVYERDPWLWVIGSDSPVLALYEDGELIVSSGLEEPRKRFRHSHLTSEQVSALLGELSVVESVGEFHGQLLEASEATDQPTNEIHSWVGKELTGVAVYGNIRHDPGARAETPEKVLKLFDQLFTYELPKADFWFPEQVEVLVWPYDHSPLEPEPWPSDWPAPTATEADAAAEASFSILLDQQHFEAFVELLSGLGSRQGIGMHGRTWSMHYRLPFPGGF